MLEKIGLIGGVVREWARQGWSVTALPADSSWRLAQGDETLYVDANQHWLCLTLPVVYSPSSNASDDGALLRLCQRQFMAKYSLDHSGQRLLQVELPIETLSRRDCHQAFEAMTVYAQRRSALLTRHTVSAVVERAWGDSDATTPVRETELFSLDALRPFFVTVEHQGWGLRDRLSLNHWKAVYKGHERAFDVYLSFDRAWAYFQVPLLGDTCALGAPSTNCQAILYPYLLKLNEQMYWAKVGLDEEGQILLLLEMPLEMFTLPYFRRAMQTLATYADTYAYDIQIMANLDQDKRLATLLSTTNA